MSATLVLLPSKWQWRCGFYPGSRPGECTNGTAAAGHWRYAHMTTLRCDHVNPPLLGMEKVVSEDAVRRGFDKIEETAD